MDLVESKIKKNVPLAPLSTFKIGGPAKYFVEVKTKKELNSAFAWAKNKKEKVYIFAGGSNLLINDKGVPGFVIKLANSEIKVKGSRLHCSAGANFINVAHLAASNNLSGLEWAIAIPGTIGGAVRGNAGAHGSKISENIETVEIYDKLIHKFNLFSKKQCQFSYKHSLFKEKQNLIIWEVVLRLCNGNRGEIDKNIENYLNIRQRSQPNLPSAGCVFLNFPIEQVKTVDRSLVAEAFSSGAIKGDKFPAGWLIEKIGLKGKTVGGAKISLEHANFIVNTGHATAEDVITLISIIKEKIRNKFNIQLHEEIEYFGF